MQEEEFNEFLNGIYWDGYAEQFAMENPKAYEKDFIDYVQNYFP